MRVVAEFDPTQVGVGSGSTINTQLPLGGGRLRMVVINQSPANMIFTFANNFSDYVLAQDRRLFDIQVQSGNVGWSVSSFIGDVIGGVTLCTIVVYDDYETIPEQYPAPIVNAATPTLQVRQTIDTVNPFVILEAQKLKTAYLLGFIATSQLAAAAVANVLISFTSGTSWPQQISFDWYESNLIATRFDYQFPSPLPGNGLNHQIKCTITGGSAPMTIILFGYWQ